MKNYILSDETNRDLNGIFNYIAENSPMTAARFVNFLQEKCRLLADSPNIGRSLDNIIPGLRMFPVCHYIILFRVKNSRTEILRIIHSSLDYTRLFKEQ